MLRVTQLSGFGGGAGAAVSAIKTLSAGGASYSLAGTAANIRNSATAKLLTAAGGSYGLTGTAATLTATSTWTDTFLQTLTSEQAGWGGYNFRLLLDASLLSTSGTVARVTMRASTTGGCSVDGAYIGHQALSGDPYDFDGNQAQIKVGGSPSFTIAANGVAVSDAISFALDETKKLIVAFHFDTTSAIRTGAITGGSGYYKNTTNETSVADVNSYSFDGSSAVKFVSRIEVHS